jgi:hypothetical protein
MSRYNDWYCPICKENIFGHKNSCLKCNYHRITGAATTSRPFSIEKGKEGKEGKTVTFFNNDDWLCPVCHFMVFSSKDACRKCGTKKEDAVVTATPREAGPGECPLCYGKDQNQYTLNCGHILCSSCHVDVLQKGENCPYCEAKMTLMIKLVAS